MKGISTFQIAAIGICAFLAIAGLLFFASFQGNSNKDAVGTVVIWGTLPKDAVQTGIDTLTSSRDEYATVSYVEKSPTSFSKQLADALASGAGPDLIIISQEQLVAERSKLSLIPYSSLPQRTYLDTYLPLFELFLSDGGTYGVPLVLDPLVLYYNRTTLSSAGVVSAPTSWEAVAGLAPAISQRTDAGGVTKSLIAFGDYANVRNARAIISLLLLQAGTPITETGATGATRSVLADDADTTFGTTPAESAVSFYAQFADPAKNLYSWNRSMPESRSMFVRGDLALYPGFASELPYLTDANPNLDFDMSAVPNPGTGTVRTTYGVGYAFAIPKAGANPTGAFFTATALSEGEAVEAMASALSMAPARRTLLTPSDDDRYGAVYLPQALVARGWLSPAPEQTDAAFAAMIGDITSGRKSLERALSDAAQAITAALR